MKHLLCFIVTYYLSASSMAQALSDSVRLPLTQLKITSKYGIRKHPLSAKRVVHEGIDLFARSDSVRSILNGVILSLNYEYGLGINIKVKHTGGMVTIYGHLSRPLMYEGDLVTAGQPIGITGKTGVVTGEHLHFEVRFHGIAVDPLKFISLSFFGKLKSNENANNSTQ